MLTNERDPAAFDLYRYDVKDYTRTLVFQNDEAFDVQAVSPDGTTIALLRPRTSADSDIYLLDTRTADAEPELITKHEGNISHGVHEFTPNSKQLVYSTDEHGEFEQAWTYELATDLKAPLVSADWDVMFVTYSDSGRYRVSAINEDANTVVRILDNERGEEVNLADLPPGDLAEIRFSRDESKIALMLSSDTSPNDVYTVDLDTGQGQRLTQALNPEIDEADLVESEVVRYESYDGLEIPSILYRPKQATGANKVPALVWVHGGPGGQSRTGYSATIQHLVNHGYAILAANNRGSSGYGKTFFHMDDRKHGEVDLQDIVQAKTYLQALDWVDGERVGIIGGSLRRLHGGRGARIRARGVRRRRQHIRRDELGAHADLHPAVVGVVQGSAVRRDGRPGRRWRTSSPHLAAVPREEHHQAAAGCPGRERSRVLQVESDEIVAAVRANDVPVEYVLFDDEGHGFTKRENKIDASEAYLAFLDKHLRPPPGRSSATN